MKKKFIEYLTNNICRIGTDESVFKSPLVDNISINSQSSFKMWLEHKLLQNTRLIIEPSIEGSEIALHYKKGILAEAVSRSGTNKLKIIKGIKNIPEQISIFKDIKIKGTLYKINKKNKVRTLLTTQSRDKGTSLIEEYKFCSYQLFKSNLNHFTELVALKKLGFEVPDSETTVYTKETYIYIQKWLEGKLFETYPSNGLIVKVNSRKFQKHLSESNRYIHWAFLLRK